MPNWCYNRVNVYGDSDTVDQVKEIYEIFENNNDPFHKIFPIPDFKNIPNDKGELPILEQQKNDKSGYFSRNFSMIPSGGLHAVLKVSSSCSSSAYSTQSSETSHFVPQFAIHQ